MTRRSQYRLGQALFVAFSVFLYLMMIDYHAELPQILAMVSPPLADKLNGILTSRTSFVVIIGVSVLFVTLLRLETIWNPILTGRDIVYKWVAIPRLVNRIVELARDELTIKEANRRSVSACEGLGVDVGDFDKNQMTLDRAWAELCYIDFWLRRQQSQPHGETFFLEQSFSWNELSERFELLKGIMAARSTRSNSGGSGFNSIKQHRDKLCRVVACYLLYMNSRRAHLVVAAKEFGIDLGEPVSANPLIYSAIYIAVLTFSVYLGTYISAFLYDYSENGKTLWQAASEPNLGYIGRRVALAFGDYGVPIIGVLALRNFVWRFNPVHGLSQAPTYAWVLLFASILSTVGLSLMVELVRTSSNASSPNSYNFFSVCQRMAWWSIGPAFICVYINYYLDRQTDPCLPDIGRVGDTRARRAIAAILFTMFIIVLTLPTVATIMPQDRSLDVSKVRFVALGTVIFITLALTMTAEFALRKPGQARSTTEHDPDGPVKAVPTTRRALEPAQS